MGRHYKIPVLQRKSKSEKLAQEGRERMATIKQFSKLEKEVNKILEEHAVAVLEAAAKEYTVDDTIFTKMIMNALRGDLNG